LPTLAAPLLQTSQTLIFLDQVLYDIGGISDWTEMMSEEGLLTFYQSRNHAT